jgi:DNA-binding NarL/FixJ family response regulator
MATRILIADDNAPVRRALRQAIESAGAWEIVEAENGAEAVAQALAAPPDLIILDLAMPEMDGLTASRQISKALPTVPIILHTLHYSPRVAVEAMKVGVRKVVPKAERSTILSAIQEVLSQSATISEAESALPPITIPAVPEASQASVPVSEPTAPTPAGTEPPSRTAETAPEDQ